VKPKITRQEILLIRLKSIGDIIFTLPAVHAMRTSFPEARFSFLVSKEYAELLQGFSPVEEVIPLDREAFRGFNPVRFLSEARSLLRRLRRNRFALAVDFHGNGETGLLTWCSGAANRWGEVYRPGRRWAYTRGISRDESVHPAQCHLAFLERCGVAPGPVFNEFSLPPSARAQGEEFFRAQALDLDRPTLFVQPLTSGGHKNWPLDRFLEVAVGWSDRGVQILFGGGPADRETLEPARRAGFPVAAGTPLLTTAALMQRSAVVLGGDTGLLHLAVALQKRVVMLMWSAGRGSNPPFGHPDWALSPRKGGSIADISVEAVNRQVSAALAK
jgi:ADP-heptose:LPS heptosyltransferase